WQARRSRGFASARAGATARDAADGAHQAHEGAAAVAGISLRGAFLPAARAAAHRVTFRDRRALGGVHRQERIAYRLLLAIKVAREMPSSCAARVRLPA